MGKQLVAANLLDRVRYFSSVSGGSWACSIFTYYRAGAVDDAALLDLGLATRPGELGLEQLAASLPEQSMARVIQKKLGLDTLKEVFDRSEENAWFRAVGELYLAPFGVVDDERPLAPCIDAAGSSHSNAAS